MAASLTEIARALLPRLTSGVSVALPTISALAAQGTPFSGAAIATRGLGGVEQALPKLSANEIIRQVRAMGFSVNRQNTLQVIKGLRQQHDAMSYIQSLKPSERPLMRRVPKAIHRQGEKYQVTIAVSGRNALSGELDTQMIKINSTRLITKREVYVAASETILGKEYYQISEITGVELINYTIQNPRVQ